MSIEKTMVLGMSPVVINHSHRLTSKAQRKEMDLLDLEFTDICLFWYFIYWTGLTSKFSMGKISPPRVFR